MTSALVVALLVVQPASERVLVLTNPSGDISERQARLYGAHLKLELAKHDGLAISRGGEQPASAEECVKEPSCLSKLAASAGADMVVFARTARLGDDSIISMKRLRISTGEIEQTSMRQISGGNGQEMLAAIGPMVTELFPREALRPGATEGVARDDVVRWSPPPVQPWMFWTSVGATAVSGVLIAVFAVQKHNAVQDFQRDVENPTGVSGAMLVNDADRAQAATHRTNAMIGVTAGLAVTSAVLGYFTDWNRDRDAQVLQTAP